MNTCVDQTAQSETERRRNAEKQIEIDLHSPSYKFWNNAWTSAFSSSVTGKTNPQHSGTHERKRFSAAAESSNSGSCPVSGTTSAVGVSGEGNTAIKCARSLQFEF
eukprot:Gregarina_sp_Poly_1__3848@NODE_2149_length_2598_cov_16_449230_g1384_i0_p3_GENE_NODE_2149_length_2598_cov_16_449230_g1384_i0NODE_2149_length_2598_cov_16_449230_g1384_i0_p3_ORF_typecomplete_len106_score12_83_NODE_2149_length_2598_cov_16_449230_g1384_i0628945